MNLETKIGAELFQPMQTNPALFVEAFDRRPWAYQSQALNKTLERDESGRFIHPITILSWPRQDTKTTLSMWIDLWRMYCDPLPQEIISVANDKDQARIKLNDARRVIRGSEILSSLIDGQYGLTRSEIRLTNGNRWIIKSAESVFSRGLRPSSASFDELGWARDAELFQVLSAGQAAQPNPLIVITSTVGPIKAGILWELFESARAGNQSIHLDYRTENLSPLVTPAYLERERAILPAHVYAREHLNLWGEGSDVYCTDDDWKRAIDAGDPRRDSDPGPCFMYVDLGWVHDPTALAIAKRENDKIKVIHLETWKGSQSQPVQFASVENRIVELCERLNVQTVRIESPQGVALSQTLTARGVNADVVHPTAKSNQEHWGALYTALKNGSIQLPNDAKLRQQLLTLTIRTNQNGWKVEDVPSIHQDHAVAVAGACYMVQIGNVAHMMKQETQKSKWEVTRPGWARQY